jgi:UDP-glucose 4-epimerase
MRDTDMLRRALRESRTEAVVHLAAISQVGTSVLEPRAYFDNNVRGALSLLDAMLDTGVGTIVFSSTAAVYGEPEVSPIEESTPLAPKSPYGDTKRMIETVLERYGTAYGLRHTSLRYFNAAGALPDCGEDHRPETHLIPRILQSALGLGPRLCVYGTDYPTPDGTCIRDYIHVADLAQAHALALRAPAGASTVFNLGSGGGFTVAEVLAAARKVTGRPIPVDYGPRRAGDPAALVASSARIRKELGWKPMFEGLAPILESAWHWHQSAPHGYNDGPHRADRLTGAPE